MTNQTVLLLADELDAKKSECEKLKLQIEAIKQMFINYNSVLLTCAFCHHKKTGAENEPCKSCENPFGKNWQPPEAPNA